jgi:hypothetical protein
VHVRNIWQSICVLYWRTGFGRPDYGSGSHSFGFGGAGKHLFELVIHGIAMDKIMNKGFYSMQKFSLTYWGFKHKST